MKILIADDEAILRSVLRDALERCGYKVVEVADGVGAWRWLQDGDPPSIAILDWTMPGLTGVEICRRVREQALLAPPYLILLSARDSPEDIVAGLDAGADDYITKPFNLVVLEARVRAGARLVSLQQTLADRVRDLESAPEVVRRSGMTRNEKRS